MIKLYDYFRSSASFRVRIALNLKKLDYDIIPIHLLNQGGEQFLESYQQLNPQSLVPTLQHDGHTLTQSLAIIEYLDDIFPTPLLLPKDPVTKAHVRSFALIIAADMHPLNNLRVLQYLTTHHGITEEEKKQWYHHWLHNGLSALEKKLSTTSLSKNFCFGDEPTLADICLVPQLYNAKRFSCDLNTYPLLQKIDQHCLQHPAFIAALPQETVV